MEANKRLIRAAPDLLDALRQFVEAEASFRYHGIMPYPGEELDPMASAYNAAKAAISKAEGRES